MDEYRAAQQQLAAQLQAQTQSQHTSSQYPTPQRQTSEDEYRDAQRRLAQQLMQQQQPASSATDPRRSELKSEASSHDECRAAQQRLARELMQQEHASPTTVAPTQTRDQARRPPPPLPPRENSSYNATKSHEYTSSQHSRPSYSDPSPSYQLHQAEQSSHRPSHQEKPSYPPPIQHLSERGRTKTMASAWESRDPRSSSTQSLRPAESHHGRRTLLLIFIHGFMGNETSFQSFPAHLHNLLSASMQESHVVHTKIYPRYKSRRAIEFARDGFSKWLEPHENPNTDIILLGHSMGGILAAEVCVKPLGAHVSAPPFKHRILGEICFDTPFLGMHPGLVGSGIASLFRPSPPPPGSVAQTQNASAGNSTTSLGVQSPGTPGTMTSDGASDYTSLAPTVSSASSIVGNDPYYNPPFPNDVHLKERTGWNKFIHFAQKHSDDFTTATKSYFMSHIEFGGCLADFKGLKMRYGRVRGLEDVDDCTEEAIEGDRRRVRFVNYYTASTGILKPEKIKNVSVKGPDGRMTPLTNSTSQLDMNHGQDRTSEDSETVTPRISIEEHREGEVVPKRTRVNTIGEVAEAQTDGPSEPKSGSAGPAMNVVKQQIGNLGENSGVKPAGTGDDELAPMQMLDAVPIMSDEEYDHSENEYLSAAEDEAKIELAADVPKDAEVSINEVTAPAPDRAAPSIPTASFTDDTPQETLDAHETPMIIRTPPTEPEFPPLPEVPAEPAPFNPADYEDKDARKIAEKDHKRLVKAYQSAMKDHASAVKDREKLKAKREKEAEKARVAEEKAAAKEAAKQAKYEEKGRKAEDIELERKATLGQEGKKLEKKIRNQKSGEELRLEQEALRMENEGRRMRGEAPLDSLSVPEEEPKKLVKSRSPSPSPSMPSLAPTASNVSQTPSTSTTAEDTKPKKPKKDRKFCLLPHDLTRSKEVDKCWVRVYMEGVDEVGAHCGLFFQGQQYESLVGDVGERISGWVREDATRRMVVEYRNVD